MKSKKLILLVMVLLTVGVVFSLTPNADAAMGWYFADVIASGGNTANTIVQLTHNTTGTPAFTGVWCRLDPANAKVMLATALTAMSLQRRVYVNLDPALSVPTIAALYIWED